MCGTRRERQVRQVAAKLLVMFLGETEVTWAVWGLLVTPLPVNSHIACILTFVFACLSVLSLCLTSRFVAYSVPLLSCMLQQLCICLRQQIWPCIIFLRRNLTSCGALPVCLSDIVIRFVYTHAILFCQYTVWQWRKLDQVFFPLSFSLSLSPL